MGRRSWGSSRGHVRLAAGREAGNGGPLPAGRNLVKLMTRGHCSPLRTRCVALLGLGALAVASGSAGAASPGPLSQRIQAARIHEQALQAGIDADSGRVASFNGRLSELQARLNAVQSTVDYETGQLAATRNQLGGARSKLDWLQKRLVRDRKILDTQLVAAYETPPPNVMTVVLDAHGFSDLLERMDDLKLVSNQNATVTARVHSETVAVLSQTKTLARLMARQQLAANSVLIQRDEIAQLRLAVVNRQLVYARARSRKTAEISAISHRRLALVSELASLTPSVNSAVASAPGLTAAAGGGGGGAGSGFFQAAGTNYSVGVESTLAARLNTLAKALGLHLIGISGYRSPSHSVEVGGFADDPHTRGSASDTPGVEGVPEATLNQYGLTRPFPGAAEADHIQLLGGPG
jgi:peptidoglycan hydrolase CwlO-like protein